MMFIKMIFKLLIITMVTACSSNKKIQLMCNLAESQNRSTYYITIDTDAKNATVLFSSLHQTENGTLKIEENNYVIDLKRAGIFHIDRYSGLTTYNALPLLFEEGTCKERAF